MNKDIQNCTNFVDLPDASVPFPAHEIACETGDGVLDTVLDVQDKRHDLGICGDVREIATDKGLIFALDLLRRSFNARTVQPTSKRLRPVFHTTHKKT